MLAPTADRSLPRAARLCAPAGDRGRAGEPERVSDAELLAAIGRDLRAVYAEVLRQPLPARLAQLLLLENTENRQKT